MDYLSMLIHYYMGHLRLEIWQNIWLQSSAVITRSNISCIIYSIATTGWNVTTGWTHKKTLYLALTGELYGAFWEDFRENLPHLNDTALYIVMLPETNSALRQNTSTWQPLWEMLHHLPSAYGRLVTWPQCQTRSYGSDPQRGYVRHDWIWNSRDEYDGNIFTWYIEETFSKPFF